MSFLSIILTIIVALEHVYIMYLETFATQSETTGRVFKMSAEERSRKSVTTLFQNQGIYNGIIGLFLLIGLVLGLKSVVLFYLVNVVLAAAYGALTSDKAILFKQGGPAILALLSFLL
ncbi:DUF1304 domain-containing protein [Streptococcus caprae]|uniref:DUF1304 domain-containing protein n=1 Tax=Streptococcus caprae TaxID=1640501 RepID=A0ABV8CVV5_9STRE